jgi:signal peptidase II
VLKKALVLLACVVTIGCDHATKYLAVVHLSERPTQSFLADTVRLDYAENAGGFLSLGADWSPAMRLALLVVLTSVMLSGMAIIAIRRRWQGTRLLGAAILIAGGLSNLVDRVATGVVVDFLNVGLGPVRTGIFNIADVAILGGAALLVLSRTPPGATPMPGTVVPR